MSKEEKLINRLLSRPKDFKFNELETLLRRFGFEKANKGPTSGSRVAFIKKSTQEIIRIHKPHPGNELGIGTLKDVINFLKEHNYI